MKTVVGLFDTYHDVEKAIALLEHNQVTPDHIGLLGRDQELHARLPQSQEALKDNVGSGALGGAAVGGVVGSLVGLGTLAVPGIGTVLAVGSLAATLGVTAAGTGVGAATGGLFGALIGMDVPEKDIHFYEEGVRQGGILLIVRVENNERMLEALRLMQKANMVDRKTRLSEWQETAHEVADEVDDPVERSIHEAQQLSVGEKRES